MKKFIEVKISGIPYSRSKTRGNISATREWTNAVVNQTKDLPKVETECVLKVIFCLPPNKYPKDLPYGPDLDNLLKRFLDALNETIFIKAKGKDSCAIEIYVKKVRARSKEETGALLKVLLPNPENTGFQD